MSHRNQPQQRTTMNTHQQQGPREMNHPNHHQRTHCPCFMIFMRVLLSYLRKHGDKESYELVKQRVQICTERSQRQEPGYEHLAQAVLQEIPQIVKPAHLQKVQAYLRLRALQKRAKHQRKGSPRNTVIVRCDLFGILHQSSV